MLNIGLNLQQQATARPKALALRQPLRNWRGQLTYKDFSFSQLEHATQAASASYHAQGLKTGMRVLVFLPMGLSLMASLFALLRLGAIPILLDPGLGFKKLLAAASHSQPDALLGTSKSLILCHFFPQLLSGLKLRIRAISASAHPLALPLPPIFAAKANDLAAILFTSGSTGSPKGVHYTHGMFQAQLQLLKEAYGLTPGGVDYPLLAVFAFFNPALGITTVLPELDPKQPMKASAKRLLEGMSKASITQAFGSPILWQKLAEAALAKGQSFPQVERLFLAGCATPPGVAEALKKVFPNAHIYIPYGATEALPLTQLDAELLIHAQTQPTHAGTYLGKALPGVAFTILPLDSDNNTPLPYETVGEVAVCGPIVSPSYDHLIEATHKAKFTDPQGRLWHRMGDVGVLDATGGLWFLGRAVECVQNGPLTWYTDPCETVFLNHPLVKRAALIGLGPKHQQTPAIIIQPKDKTYLKNKFAKNSLESALLELARSHPTTKAIKTIFFRSTFPVDVRHNAKIHRLTLAKEYTHKR